MSDIKGSGYGDVHDWRYENSNNSKRSFYRCARCGALFVHAYDAIPDIFVALKSYNVPATCEAKP